jgi:hypothetical protein
MNPCLVGHVPPVSSIADRGCFDLPSTVHRALYSRLAAVNMVCDRARTAAPVSVSWMGSIAFTPRLAIHRIPTPSAPGRASRFPTSAFLQRLPPSLNPLIMAVVEIFTTGTRDGALPPGHPNLTHCCQINTTRRCSKSRSPFGTATAAGAIRSMTPSFAIWPTWRHGSRAC